MTAKEELHALVDQLEDEQTDEVLALVRWMLNGGGTTGAVVDLERGYPLGPGPATMAGRAFFSQPHRSLADLAAAQGVEPVRKFDDLIGDFWPEDETADDFVAALREWRREDEYA